MLLLAGGVPSGLIDFLCMSYVEFHQYLGLQPPGHRGGRQEDFFLQAKALTTCLNVADLTFF